ncbi:MAG: PHP domain-containing protein [Thermodesulfobacteriota bacterium]
MDYDRPRSGAIDLHIHSTASDGSETPREILSRARALHLRAIAITDHDTVDGAREALAAGIPDSLGFATGVEFSAEIPPSYAQNGTLHILGYFMDLDHPDLGHALSLCQEARSGRNPKIMERLREMGVPITLAEVEKVAGSGQVGRPHIARVLVQKGVVKTVDEAFTRYIGKGKPAYVGKFRLAAEEAIRVIRRSGGVPVLAHPFSLEMADAELFRLADELSRMGLGGIEAYYPGHGPDLTKKYLELARRLGLVATGGTDYHGKSKPEIGLGFGKGDLFIPYDLFEKLAGRSRQEAGNVPERAAALPRS